MSIWTKKAFSYLFPLCVIALTNAPLLGQFAEVGNVFAACDSYDGLLYNGGAQIGLLEGEESDYYFVWTHDGLQSLYHNDLPPGEYLFYIEDQFGCSQNLEVVIPAIGTICKPEVETWFSDDDCLHYVEVTFFSSGGSHPSSTGYLSPEVFEITWSHNNSTTPTTTVEFPSGEDQVEICYEMDAVGVDGTCCSVSRCILVNKSPKAEFCHVPEEGCYLIINEIVKDGDGSFYEFVVVDKSGDRCLTGCNLKGYIIDDNNGDLLKGNETNNDQLNQGIDKGYVTLSDSESWGAVPPGSKIVLIKDNKWDAIEIDPTDSDGDGTYIVWIRDVDRLTGFYSGFGSTTSSEYTFNGAPTLPVWDFIDFDKGFDGMQTRAEDNRMHAIATGSTIVNQMHGDQGRCCMKI